MLTPQEGELIAGRYRLERELARGGMGSVWAGRDTKLRRKVAVKLVAPDWLSGERASGHAALDATERFEREAMAVAQLSSPHVVQIFDYGLEREVPYIVMELLEGEDLRSRLHRLKRVSLETAALVLVQTAKALSVAHAAGIVHRDLKPGNVFLVRAGEEEIVKVLDFGVAMQVTDLLEREDNEVIGTPQFMSPEQARGLPDLDHRADLWSLGVIIYKALTGRLPFQGGSPTDVIVKVCTQDPEPVSKLAPDLPRELDGFFTRALARDPDRRFESARQMALAFSRISPVNFTTLSMPDPKMIEQAIAQAKAAGAIDEDEAETLAVDALTMLQLDDVFLEDLKTKAISAELIAARLPQPKAPRKSALPRPPAPGRRPRPPLRSSSGPSSGSRPPASKPLAPPRSRPPVTLRGAGSGGPPAPSGPPVVVRHGDALPATVRGIGFAARAQAASGGDVAPGTPGLTLPLGSKPPSVPGASSPGESDDRDAAEETLAAIEAPLAAERVAQPGDASPDDAPPDDAQPDDAQPGDAPSREARAPLVVTASSSSQEADGDLGRGAPLSRTLDAVEREPDTAAPQMRRAVGMAIAAAAVGALAAVIGSAIFRDAQVASLGLIAGLDDARAALAEVAAAPAPPAEDPPPTEGTAGSADDGDAETAASSDAKEEPPPKPTVAAAPPPWPRPVAPAPPPPKEAPPPPPVDVFSERL